MLREQIIALMLNHLLKDIIGLLIRVAESKILKFLALMSNLILMLKANYSLKAPLTQYFQSQQENSNLLFQ